MRRLTHTEFDNTVRDLLGVALDVTDRFPAELTGSSALMERMGVRRERFGTADQPLDGLRA